MHLAARYNPDQKTWSVRKKVRTPHKTGDGVFRENLYGYGATIVEAIDDLMKTTTLTFSKIVCKAITPSKHIFTFRIN